MPRTALRLPQLVLVEAAAALVLLGLTAGPVPSAGCVGGAVALLAAALPRRNGLTLAGQLRLRAAARNRRRHPGPVDPGTDPALVPLLECAPGLRTVRHTPEAGPARARREHREIGMTGDGSFLSAVIQVEPVDTPLRPAPGDCLLPLDLLAAGLVVEDVVLSSVQAVQFSRPAAAPQLPGEPPPVRGHQELPHGMPAPGLRRTWVAVRLDPDLCRGAVAARGGGERGARRALQRAADQLAARLGGAGLRATVLDAAGAVAALTATACGHPAAGPGRRTSETVRAWRCDDRWHTTYWISHWPRTGPGPVGQLGSHSVDTTTSLTIRQHRPGELSLTGMVRITSSGEHELERAAKELEAQAANAGAALVRLEHEQAPGLLATLPLGGVR